MSREASTLQGLDMIVLCCKVDVSLNLAVALRAQKSQTSIEQKGRKCALAPVYLQRARSALRKALLGPHLFDQFEYAYQLWLCTKCGGGVYTA